VSPEAGRVPPRALTIAGSDSSGGAGIQADLKTFMAHHVHGMAAVTAVTVQNSVGVSGIYDLPPRAVAEQIEAVVTDIGVDAVKIGMLLSADIIEAVAETLHRLNVRPIVLDPVAVSKHGDPLLHETAVAALREHMLPLADLVTPNVGEAHLFTGIHARNRASQCAAADALRALGARSVLVKGGHLPDEDDAVDLFSDGQQVIELRSARIPTRHTHGTGCTLSAAIGAGLARGLDLESAVRAGKAYVTAGIAASYPLGKGIGPVGHFWRVREPASALG
jgi:hydroxymethylpyrimidine/phosphomethylpyrimidine kinase